MPNVIWASTVKAKDGRGGELNARALKLAELARSSGAVSARFFQSNAGPAAPSSTFVMEFTSLGHLEEVQGKLFADSWFQEAYLMNTDPPSTILRQGIAIEVEG